MSSIEPGSRVSSAKETQGELACLEQVLSLLLLNLKSELKLEKHSQHLLPCCPKQNTKKKKKPTNWLLSLSAAFARTDFPVRTHKKEREKEEIFKGYHERGYEKVKK